MLKLLQQINLEYYTPVIFLDVDTKLNEIHIHFRYVELKDFVEDFDCSIVMDRWLPLSISPAIVDQIDIDVWTY